MQSHDRTCVSLVHIVLVQPSFGASTVIPVGLVDIAFFRPDPKRRRLVVREIKRRNGDFARLVVAGVHKLKRFLYKIKDEMNRA